MLARQEFQWHATGTFEKRLRYLSRIPAVLDQNFSGTQPVLLRNIGDTCPGFQQYLPEFWRHVTGTFEECWRYLSKISPVLGRNFGSTQLVLSKNVGGISRGFQQYLVGISAAHDRYLSRISAVLGEISVARDLYFGGTLAVLDQH